MPDFATSSDPAVQRQLDRLARLSPGGDVLGLDRIERLCARLGDPHRKLPPVFHVAGTNGKGSTCAYLRAMLEAAGMRVHVYTSPHLVRFNERIRLAGQLIEDSALAALLGEVLDAADGIEPSFFEATTAAAYLAFARAPADACIVEVGLGGRLDATNVIEAPVVAGIAALGLDHQQFLGESLAGIAGEKAGIAKRGAPLVTLRYDGPLRAAVAQAAGAAGAEWVERGTAWDARVAGEHLTYSDACGSLDLPLPALHGAHQADNAALAVAMLRHAPFPCVDASAMARGIETTSWPARLQRLATGPLTDLLPAGSELWLDGGHNPDAARAVAMAIRPDHIVLGLLANKDAGGVLDALAATGAAITAIPVPGHEHHLPEALADMAEARALQAAIARDVPDALAAIGSEGGQPRVLIAGSLYLAGAVLSGNGEAPS